YLKKRKSKYLFFCVLGNASSGIRTTHDRCTGESMQYELCGTQPCPAGQVSSISFRAAQCRFHNNKKVLGRVINSWVPYTQGGINPCALVCEGEGEGIVYTFGKVIDGTYCKTEKGRQGLCVNGRCLRLSCDGRLGGTAFEDMCRVCGGKNETCTRHSGIFRSERPSSDQPSPGLLTSKTPKQKNKYFSEKKILVFITNIGFQITNQTKDLKLT
ncbi:ADAMTS-like protein 5, partial [Armadillidium nasatum]